MEELKKFLRSENMIFELTDFGITFKYQGLRYAIFEDEDDAQFIQIALPSIVDIENVDITPSQIFILLNKIARERKCIKPVLIDDTDVWLNVEILIDATPRFGDFFFRSLNALGAARSELYTYIQEYDKYKKQLESGEIEESEELDDEEVESEE